MEERRNGDTKPEKQTTDDESEEIDDWGLECNFHLFAQHQPQTVYLNKEHESFQILCVESLTPIDMSNLGSGIHDATGHCVWTGAFLLIACLDRLQNYFQNKTVLELGSGTGIGGIAVLQAAQPKRVLFTDSDPQALDLCQRNCLLNKCDKYDIQELTWGEQTNDFASTRLDTVLATDVLYDIGLLPALFTSAQEHGNVFVLSHVPRACYNTNHPPVENLDAYIVQHAQQYGFYLQSMVRPLDGTVIRPVPKDALNNVSLQEMHDIGAAIFVFVQGARREENETEPS